MQLYKHGNHRNLKYLAWLRKQNCVVSNISADVAHHIRLGTNGGQGLKPSDYFCVPLTDELHTTGNLAVHRIGEESFLRDNEIDKEEIFLFYLSSYALETFDFKINSKASTLEKIELVINEIEKHNNPAKRAKKTKSKTKTKTDSKPKVSITESAHYQKAKELKKAKDKELRLKLKEEKPKVKVTFSGNDYYESAKELQKEYAKKIRDENKQSQSEYRKKMYQAAKQKQKAYLLEKKNKK